MESAPPNRQRRNAASGPPVSTATTCGRNAAQFRASSDHVPARIINAALHRQMYSILKALNSQQVR